MRFTVTTRNTAHNAFLQNERSRRGRKEYMYKLFRDEMLTE